MKKRTAQPTRVQKSVFVIMPFTKTPTRNKSQLTAFFASHIKGPIEKGKFACKYTVRRSDDTFNINAQIVKDLYAADIVICDLSGPEANPNVMYELGMRLAFSNKPVILIREAHKDNRPIFDIGGFYTEQYDPLNYSAITEHLQDKIRKLESGVESYESPVLRVVGEDTPLLTKLSARRAAGLLSALGQSLHGTLRLFAGAVHDYAKKHAKVDLGDTPADVVQNLQRKAKITNKIPWDRFHFRLGSQPALDHYLATRYLLGLVESDIETKFTECLIDYHAHFLCGDAFTNKWIQPTVVVFLAETIILRTISDIIAGLLLADTAEDRKTYTADFEAVYAERHIG